MTFDKYQDRCGARFVTLNTYQDRFRAGLMTLQGVCYVDRVQGLLQGSDLIHYRDGTGVYLVAKNVPFAT